MTWYWWTHWFWITSLSATISCFPFGSVDTSPSSNPYNHGKIYNKGEPLKFPIAVQSDSDDIFDGRELLEAKFNDDWMSTNIRLRNVEKVGQGIDGLEKNKTNINDKTSKAESNTDHPIGNISIGIEIINITIPSIEGFNVPLLNSSTKNSSTASTSSAIIPNSNQPNITIIQASDVNATTGPAGPRVEKITKLKNISIKSQATRPEIYANRQNNITGTTPEQEVVRGEIERETISDRGRQSKILAEYSETLKIMNFTSASKNLLARSAISISSNDVDDEDDLNSEALIIKRATILDAGAISGICLAILGLSCAVSAAGVILYRRRYINKPQTLSEPDSSGYIDDSTIRDNSDEMYSLDNDSFLNSLEAMTIQNYWTDNVKHTKL